MLLEKQTDNQGSLRTQLLKMKGQAVPLCSYHILRDYVMPSITGDYQRSILYWAGKDLAAALRPSSSEELIHLYLDMGWGHLNIEQNQKKMKTFTLESPSFAYRQIEDNDATFALECGFLAQSLAYIEQTETEAHFEIKSSRQQDVQVQFTVYLQDKENSVRNTG